MSADDAWDDLNAALEHYTPPCAGHAVFTADSRTDEQRAECASICRRCAVSDRCNHYATTAAESGFWAGAERSAKRRRSAASTTAPGGSPAPMKGNTP